MFGLNERPCASYALHAVYRSCTEVRELCCDRERPSAISVDVAKCVVFWPECLSSELELPTIVGN